MQEQACDRYGMKPMLETLVDSGALDCPIGLVYDYPNSFSFSLLHISLDNVNEDMHSKLEFRVQMYIRVAEFFLYDALFDKYHYVASVPL